MMKSSEILARMRKEFKQRYEPSEALDYRRYEFELDLDRLIYAAFAAAQEPYVKQFNLLQEQAVRRAFISPTGSGVKDEKNP